MASTAETSAAESSKTPAQLLAEQHALHHATVEDIVDEEDIEHLPPSHSEPAAESTTNGTNGTNEAMSAKAAGKQKEKPTVLDTHDEEAFPTLGAATKTTTKAPGWGVKGSLKTPATPPLSSGASTPSLRPAGLQTGMGAVSLPGTNRDHFDIETGDIDKKKSIDKVLADVKRKYRVTTGVQEINAGKARRFYAEGPQKAQVRQALMDISKAISVEQRIKIPIPASASPVIIGKGGANIRQWEQEHGVRINIERDQRPSSSAPEDPRIDIVEVRGDAAATRVVNQKISEMVRRNQPKVNLSMREIPPEFYPFLAARHAAEIEKLQQNRDLDIRIPKYHQWQAQAPPRAAPGARPAFVPHGESHIVLSGEQEAAMQAKLAIEQLVKQLEQELNLQEHPAEQALHPHIVGERGMDPAEFLERTGCAVIVPPDHEETDEIHIIGPVDRIPEAEDLLNQLMNQKHNRPVDLRKQFANAPHGPERHSRALARYLQQKALQREFSNSHDSEVVFPVNANAAPSWAVISSDPAKAMSARTDLAKIAAAFPTSRIHLVEMDPFYHPHIEDMFAQQLQNDHGVVMIVPENDDDHVVLVYEGPAQEGPFTLSRQRPTTPEQREFERALQAAQEFLLGSIPTGDITAAELPVPPQHHDRVERFVRNQQQPPAGTFPVQVDFGRPRGKRPAARQQAPQNLTLRGPSPDDIEALRKQIEAFLVEVERDEKERDYVTSCDFPEKFVNKLVGKNGANIKALREKHDVEIDTREAGKVKIQGPQKKAEACKQEIIKLGKTYEDEVSYSISVDPKFHGELIGKSGENLNKLQARVDNLVRIDFPRASRSGDASDNASEAGAPGQRQAPNEIRIRGPKAKADKVREELLSYTQHLQDTSHEATVSVHKDQVRSLIGRGGSELEKLRTETGAAIDVPNKADGERVTITIKGAKASVDKARQEIQKRSKAFDSIVTRTITVDRKHHRDLIGSKGSNIQKIVHDAGGPERSAEAVQFPKQGDDSSTLTVRGTADVVEKVVNSIQSFVEDKDAQVTEVVDIPMDQHRTLIGTAGNIRKSIEQQFNISLDIPRRESGKTGVKIAGRPNGVAQAKEHILKLTKQPEGTTIMVPRAYHHLVANDGRIFRDLSRQGIKVDHKGQQPPKKPTTNGAARNLNTADAPLITDDPSAAATHSFNITSMNSDPEDETGEIPWVLIGNRDVTEDDIAKVQQQIEAAIEKAREPKHIGYLRLADPQMHRHVIGSKGTTINSIRKKTGCDIQVPGGGRGNDGEEITIVGSESGVQLARGLILEEVEKAGGD